VKLPYPPFVRAWVRYGLVAGVIAFGSTVAANLAITWPSPADLCRMGPFAVAVLSLVALVIFVWMAGAAGFKTARAGSPAPDPTLAGLLVGVLGGCALVVLLPFSLWMATRIVRKERGGTEDPNGKYPSTW